MPDQLRAIRTATTGLVADLGAMLDPSAKLWVQYADDPCSFVTKILREHYYGDIERMMESVAHNRITIAQSGNAVGKTWGAARVAFWWLMCHQGAQVWTFAAPPEDNLDLVWGQLGDITRAHPSMLAGYGMGVRSIERVRDREGIWGVTIPVAGDDSQRQARASGKHAPWLLFIVDEGDAVPDAIYRGIESCMSGGEARLLIIFNPRSQSGPVWRMQRDGSANIVKLSALNHPNVISGTNIYPGAVTRETTLDRFKKWTAATEYVPDDPTVVMVPEWGVEELGAYRKITDPDFAVMVLGEYSPVGTEQHVFPVSYLQPLYDRVCGLEPALKFEDGENGLGGMLEVYEEPDQDRDVEYVIGVDVAEGLNEDGDRDYSVMDVFDCVDWSHVASYWGRSEPTAFAGDVASVAAYYGEAMCVVERNNHGHAVIAELKRLGCNQFHEDLRGNVSALSIGKERAGFGTTTRTKAVVDANLQHVLEQAAAGVESVTLRGSRAINELLHYVHVKGGKRRAEGGYHDDHVRSVGLAVWYLNELTHRHPQPPRPRKLPVLPAGGSSRYVR